MKTTLKIILLLCLTLFITITLSSCSKRLTFDSTTGDIPIESYIVIHKDIGNTNRFFSIAYLNSGKSYVSDGIDIFTNYADAEKAALQNTPAYIFKLYSKTVFPPYTGATIEKIGEHNQ
jgi:hypothetical protein